MHMQLDFAVYTALVSMSSGMDVVSAGNAAAAQTGTGAQ